MKAKLMLPLLAIAAFIVTPASANWFHNPAENINRNIGSAPNPTPEDLRAMRVPIVVKDEDKTGTTTAQTATAGKSAAETPKADTKDTLAAAIGRMFAR
jgi:hypothetical protein